jgi:serine/threonine-protein kinase
MPPVAAAALAQGAATARPTVVPSAATPAPIEERTDTPTAETQRSGTAVSRTTASRESSTRTAANASQGVIAFAVAPWGAVYVDGDARGTTPPLTQLTLPAGRHTIEIRNGDQAPYVAQVDVTPERPQQIRHRFQ